MVQMSLGGGGFDPRRGPGFDPRSLVGPTVLILLVASGALSWLFQGFFILFFVVPLVAAPALSWYINSNLIEGSCPECSAPVQGFKGQRTVCMSCGATMSDVLVSGVFVREGAAATADGVVEVEAVVDVDAN